MPRSIMRPIPWVATAALLVALPVRAQPGSDPAGSGACAEAVQGRIAWDYRGSTRWAESNIEKLCAGAEDSTEPATCFDRAMHGGLDWGGGTRWEWGNALELCRGTRDASGRIQCFERAIAAGTPWSDAIQRCRRSPVTVRRPTPGDATARSTDFDPSRHGFRFANTFNNDFIREFDVRTGGLCGGMVYAALDYYLEREPIPAQDHRPPTNSVLHDYIYDRQVHSITDNLDKWIEIGFNPFGARSSEFFRWGLQGFGGGRLQELRALIDRGVPAPLGLYNYGGEDSRGDHQVLAIGYDLGRYKGDLKGPMGDLKIYVYDPNFPGETLTLVPDLTAQGYRYLEASSDDRKKGLWRTYFVDGKYAAKDPPTVPTRATVASDGLVRELLVRFNIGNDDLRGGEDNVHATVHFRDGSTQRFDNINGGRRWLGNYNQTVSLPLNRPTRPADLVRLQLDTTFGGGIAGDNWNIDGLKIEARGGGVNALLFERHGAPLVRLTGERRSYSAALTYHATPPGPSDLVRELVLHLQTGGDDLRGGSDNLNITVELRDAAPVVRNNVNSGTTWGGNSWNTVTIVLPTPVPIDRIGRMTLATTFGGGIGGDNWNLDTLVVHARGDGLNRKVYERSGSPLRRFTGTDKTLTIMPEVR